MEAKVKVMPPKKAMARTAEPIPMTVSEGLTVSIIPNSAHQFLMTTREVAKGYGVSPETIQGHRHYNTDELKEGVHFIRGFEIQSTLFNAQPTQLYWTKAGVIRLGFFVKSERGIAFRDWAEKVILEKINAPKADTMPPAVRRQHNRLTPTRLLSIMADVVRIEDSALRHSITAKLLR